MPVGSGFAMSCARTERPHAGSTREQIKAVAKRAWADPGTLRDLVEELGERQGPEPDSLRFKLVQRLAEIERAAGGLTPSRSPELPGSAQGSRPALLEHIRSLETALAAARDDADKLRSELTVARDRAKRLETEIHGRSPGSGLYARVGLDQRCPDFLVTAARRAYRKHFHPDHHAGPAKASAEAAFKDAEAVFERILSRRAGMG